MTIRDEPTKGQKPLKAKKEYTMSKTTNTAKKGNNTSEKATKGQKPELMTYPQAMALTNALFHSNATVKTMSEKLDKLNGNSKPVSERLAKYLEEHGNDHATYGQCKAYAFGLLNAKKTSHEEASKAIEALDKKNGYVRQPKAEKAVKEANETAKAETAKQASLLDDIVEESDNKDTPKA